MNLESALEVLKKAIKKQKEYETKKVETDLIIDGKNYKGWYVTAFKDGKVDIDFFRGWIKIRDLVDEFYKHDKTESLNGLNKVLQELE